MPHSTHWSSTSAPCRPDSIQRDPVQRITVGAQVFRLEWRPSRWVMGVLCVLTLLAPFAVLHSALAPAIAWPLAAAALAWGLWALLCEACKSVHRFELGAGGNATLDGRPLAAATFQWRGPLLFLHWRVAGGQGGRLAWWPDTLAPAKRRELRMTAGMAP